MNRGLCKRKLTRMHEKDVDGERMGMYFQRQ